MGSPMLVGPHPPVVDVIKLFLRKSRLIALKIVYSCFFGLRGNLDFPDFLQKKFYNINSRIILSNTFSILMAR